MVMLLGNCVTLVVYFPYETSLLITIGCHEDVRINQSDTYVPFPCNPDLRVRDFNRTGHWSGVPGRRSILELNAYPFVNTSNWERFHFFILLVVEAETSWLLVAKTQFFQTNPLIESLLSQR